MDITKARESAQVEADLLTWMAVHGNLLLALRHPQNVTSAAKIAQDFADSLGRLLVESGFLSEAELAQTLRVEREERGRPQ